MKVYELNNKKLMKIVSKFKKQHMGEGQDFYRLYLHFFY